jgi:hypothetical protein
MNRCTSKSKRSGERCRKPPARGRATCRFHGGSSLVGPAAPAFKTGRYSKLLPAGLAERYTEALSDAELLGLRDEVALVDVRLAALLERVTTGESAKAWRELVAAMDAFTAARARGDIATMNGTLNRVAEIAAAGQDDTAAWAEIVSLLDERRKLAESERKRLAEAGQWLSVEQATVLLTAVVDAVRRNVSDPASLRAIGDEINRLREQPALPDGGRVVPFPRASNGRA